MTSMGTECGSAGIDLPGSGRPGYRWACACGEFGYCDTIDEAAEQIKAHWPRRLYDARGEDQQP